MLCISIAIVCALADVIRVSGGRVRLAPAVQPRAVLGVVHAPQAAAARVGIAAPSTSGRAAWTQHLAKASVTPGRAVASAFVAAAVMPKSGRRVRTRRGAEPTDSGSMEAAPTYYMDFDPITAELDSSAIPEGVGIYAVYDDSSKLQYVGMSRSIRKSIDGHAKVIGPADGPLLISSVKCLEMPGSSKEELKDAWQRWIQGHMDAGLDIPPGNLPESVESSDGRWRARTGGGQAAEPLKLAGAAGIYSHAEALAAVEKAVAQHPILLFMKGTPTVPQCGFSARTVGILKEVGAKFDSVNVMDGDANPGVREAVKEFSSWPTIPQLFVSGQLIGGADIVAEMYAAQTLQETLRAATSSAPAEASSAGNAEPASYERGEVLTIDDTSRPTATALSRALSEQFDLYGLRIRDDSAAHEGDAGALAMGLTGESHFTVEVVAPEFEGLTPVQRQQRVFATLADVMPRIHALSLVTKTPAEVAA